MENRYVYVKNLSVGYNKRVLISDINIDILKGEIVVLIGPNGCGKSTILKSITRHLKAIHGDVFVGDKSLFKQKPKEMAKEISVVLTERIAPELMTCREIVAMGRYPYTNCIGKLTETDNKIVDEALGLVNAKELSEKNFDKISDGQRQRIMLARALCQKTDVMVLDEPTSYLDIRYKVDFLNILRKLSREGMSIILSLHEIDLAYKLADRIICVKDDSVVIGKPEEIFDERIINEVFGLDKGEYNSLLGNVELSRPEGEPKVLVVGGNGSGVNIYRGLQKKGIPFATGFLFENDVDFAVAKALAAEVVSSKPFEKIPVEVENRMLELVDEVEQVFDCGCTHGEFDNINIRVIKKAEACGKLKHLS